MSLHPELNNLVSVCGEILGLNKAIFHLAGEQGASKNQMQKLMYSLCKDRLNEELEYNVRKLKKMLNDHYAKHDSCLFKPVELKSDKSPEESSSNIPN